MLDQCAREWRRRDHGLGILISLRILNSLLNFSDKLRTKADVPPFFVAVEMIAASRCSIKIKTASYARVPSKHRRHRLR